MHERDYARDHATTATTLADDALSPGRASRSSRLDAPIVPLVSGLIQRKQARDDNGVADDANLAVATAASSSGTSLPEPIMRKFESSLGADLSSVRVHTGAESAVAATSVGARAYTTGQDIHFAEGQYDPSSSHGEHLLAHEVAHTVQQRGGVPMRQNKLEVSSPQDAAEHEADRAADAMVTGHSATIGSASGLSRQIMRDSRVAAVTLAGSVPSQISGMQASFHAVMAEADAILEGIKFHYDYVNSIYAGCFANHKVVVGQANAQAESNETLRDVIFEGVALVLGVAVELKAVEFLEKAKRATELVEAASVVNKARQLVPGSEEGGTEGGGADPKDMRIVGLERVFELTNPVRHYRNQGDVVFDSAVAISSEIGSNAPASGQIGASQNKKLLELKSICEVTLADAQALVADLRVLGGRRKVRVPSWQETEQDIWIAWFVAEGSMYAATATDGLINRHMVSLGLWGAGGERGGRTGLPATFNSGPTPTVEIAGHEDADEQKSIPPQHLDMFGMVSRLATELPAKWARLFLLRD